MNEEFPRFQRDKFTTLKKQFLTMRRVAAKRYESKKMLGNTEPLDTTSQKEPISSSPHDSQGLERKLTTPLEPSTQNESSELIAQPE